MVNLLPAILIGGPPNAGKSVLFYSLTKTLHERGVVHHAIRACPDGEGNWYQEIHGRLDPETIRLIRYRNRKDWTSDFVQGICKDLEGRHLPMLVDMGGKPQEWQTCILTLCTHSILLLREDEPESAEQWHKLVKDAGLLPLADIRSELYGVPAIIDDPTVLQGILTGLERGALARGPLFDALVERITKLFSSYSLEQLEQAKLALSPASYTINVFSLWRKFDEDAGEWKRDMLPKLANELPANVPLAVYGRGPGWLYAMVAALAPDFYQFDPRIGWLTPPKLNVGSASDTSQIEVHLYERDTVRQLSLTLKNQYLDHLQTGTLSFPQLPRGSGLILEGRVPHWLLTALVRLYRDAGASWIACYQPTLKGAVVVTSHVPEHTPGDLVPLLNQ